MVSIITGSILLSLLHALIPNHWLPVIAIGKKEGWSLREITRITLITAVAHVLSTVLLGFILGLAGAALARQVETFTHWVAPAILIIMGLVFIYRHHTHKHFHIDDPNIRKKKSTKQIIVALSLAMFFSPCLEIEAYFLLAGAYGYWLILSIALLYGLITITGMIILVRMAWQGTLKLNWHRLEHSAGIITGVTLILTGLLAFFLH